MSSKSNCSNFVQQLQYLVRIHLFQHDISILIQKRDSQQVTMIYEDKGIIAFIGFYKIYSVFSDMSVSMVNESNLFIEIFMENLSS
ncbi:unnamed protein product [Paramecium sonneborni]|uniref:Uncharacterized protein n=1 Tax=Paramecium sonneborni TaxID=65129 RepID=A0A8S1R2P3_9CILI|nr:unnamed protein product [Paramecium sonneborni]